MGTFKKRSRFRFILFYYPILGPQVYGRRFHSIYKMNIFTFLDGLFQSFRNREILLGLNFTHWAFNMELYDSFPPPPSPALFQWLELF